MIYFPVVLAALHASCLAFRSRSTPDKKEKPAPAKPARVPKIQNIAWEGLA
ncbi:hypothetical protein CEV31_1144 [Brucella thiophenivorans]|uniref:Uncharacterized protein n=1 Tax=Brucella thiophenivorans TaxID=571255 RepID=A0A256FY70_9HYPH|nr:hypothetical protein CEV31_1144 [Brucella thiophenivorans]